MATAVVGPLVLLLIVAGIVGVVLWAVAAHKAREGDDAATIEGPASGPREIFLHLLAFFSLYVSVIGFIVGAWATADRMFPLPFESSPGLMNSGIRLAISLVVVTFPLFVYLNWYINRKIKSGEMAPSSRLRQVLGYLTVFIVAITALIDLIVIVFQYLGGEFTARSGMKAGTVLVVMALVYLYYMSDLRGQE